MTANNSDNYSVLKSMSISYSSTGKGQVELEGGIVSNRFDGDGDGISSEVVGKNVKSTINDEDGFSVVVKLMRKGGGDVVSEAVMRYDKV